jgi:pyruvate dehydrogenase E2 component (dihydrolipoamide acetyltransferase)
MPQTVEVKVPDIGDFTDVPVIEVLVKAGDSVKAEDSLVTLESDKATMDVPSPAAGVVKDVKVKLGDKVSEGSVIVTLEAGNGAKAATPAQAAAASAATPAARPAAPPAAATSSSAPAAATQRPSASAPAGQAQAIEVKVPDIGDFKDVPVIEVLVKPGDTVQAEDSLGTLESEKATMDVPSPSAGVIREVKVKLGDKVNEGNVIVILEPAGGGASAAPAQATSAGAAPAAAPSPSPAPSPAASPSPEPKAPSASAGAVPSVDSETFKKAHASPSVRALARELGVDLSRVKGSGKIA